MIKHFIFICVLISLVFTQSFNTYLMGYMQGNYYRDTFGGEFSIGDINDDGFDDLAIYSAYDTTGNYFGEVDIYFGSSQFDTIADITLNGNFHNQFFGRRILMDGDFNRDGIDDLVLGNPGYDNEKRLAKIYYGGSPFNTTADLTFQEAVTQDEYFGGELIAIDFNNDGYDDLAIGAPINGGIYLYLGGADMDTIADGFFQEPFTNIASAGDFNNDGYEDLFTNGNAWTYLYYGGDTVNTEVDLVFHANGSMDANDYNGDGYVDLYISQTGIFLGGDVPDTTVDIVSPIEMRGHPASGHFNRDGFSDLLVGQWGYGCGVVYLHLGNNPMDNTPDGYFSDSGCGELGKCTGSGDFNGDGVDDMVIGEPLYYNFLVNRPDYRSGRVYVFSGDTTNLAITTDEPILSREFKLFDPYPNPFNVMVTIPYKLQQDSHIIARLYDINGRLVDMLINEKKTAGFHELTYNANQLPTGVYLLQFVTKTGSSVKKIILLK